MTNLIRSRVIYNEWVIALWSPVDNDRVGTSDCVLGRYISPRTAFDETMSTFTEVEWKLPGEDSDVSRPSQNALIALQSVQSAVKKFDECFNLRNEEREKAVPLFGPDEVIIEVEKDRSCGYCVEYGLLNVRLIMDTHPAEFGSHEQETRNRFSDRCDEGNFYAIKFLQDGLIDSDHGPGAASDMIIETKILMNMAPHPNISQLYGVNIEGIDSFLESGRKSFFFFTDRIKYTLTEQLELWKCGNGYNGDENDEKVRQDQRLEVALDISSAIEFLHDRSLVYYVRPDKVGFDTRYGRVKLCNFCQARHIGMKDHARSITKSDDIKTLAYTAPEVLCKAPTTTSSDVYAFGIMLWEMMGLKPPFEGYCRSSHFDDVIKCAMRPAVMPSWPSSLKELIQESWHPHKRPRIKVVKEMLEACLIFADDLAAGVANPLQKAKEKHAEEATQKVERMKGSRSQVNGQIRNQSDRSSSSKRGSSKGPKSPGRKRSSSRDEGRPRTPSNHRRSLRSKSPSPSLHNKSSSSRSGAARSKSPSVRLSRSSSNVSAKSPDRRKNRSKSRSKSPGPRLSRSSSSLLCPEDSSQSVEEVLAAMLENQQRSKGSPRKASLRTLSSDKQRAYLCAKDDKSTDSVSTGSTIPDAVTSDGSTASHSLMANHSSRSSTASPSKTKKSRNGGEFDAFGSPKKTPVNKRKGLTKQGSLRRSQRKTDEYAVSKGLTTPIFDKERLSFDAFSPGSFSPSSDPFRNSPTGLPASPRKRRSPRRKTNDAVDNILKTAGTPKSNGIQQIDTEKDMASIIESLRSNFTENGFDNIPTPSLSPSSPDLPRTSSLMDMRWAEGPDVVSPRRPNRSKSFVSTSPIGGGDRPRRKGPERPPITRLASNAKRRTSFA